MSKVERKEEEEEEKDRREGFRMGMSGEVRRASSILAMR